MSKALFLASRDPKDNHLLAALPEATYQGLLPFLEWVPLPALGLAVYESGSAQGYVYFPTGSSVTAEERQGKRPGTGLPFRAGCHKCSSGEEENEHPQTSCVTARIRAVRLHT